MTKDEVRARLSEMELMYDGLFSSPSLMLEYNALRQQLNAFPSEPFDKIAYDRSKMVKAIKENIAAIRLLRQASVSAQKRVDQLREQWPFYKSALRTFIAREGARI